MRRPTSGGLGFGSWPLADREELLPDGPRRHGPDRDSRRAPCRWISSRSPQTPVRSVARSQKTRTSEPYPGMARPQPFIVTSAPEARRAMTTPRMSTGRPSSSSHAATSAISSPAMSVTVLSMWAPVSNRKPPPDDRRILAPRPGGLHRPVLPHERIHVEERPDVAARDHPRRGPDLRREASGEGDDEQATGPVARRDQHLGFGRVHDHRLLEDDVDAGLQAGDRLGGVEHVRRDDEDGIERRREPLDEALPVRFVRGDGKTDGA